VAKAKAKTPTAFTKRVKELVRDIDNAELGHILGVTTDGARKLRLGNTVSLKLQAGLRLAAYLGISPWYLAGEPEPATPLLPPDVASRQGRRKKVDHTLVRTQLDVATSDLLLADEVAEIRSRIEHLEAAFEGLQSRG
jgi:hypothetical protein